MIPNYTFYHQHVMFRRMFESCFYDPEKTPLKHIVLVSPWTSPEELSGAERMGHMHQQNVGVSYNGVPVMDGL